MTPPLQGKDITAALIAVGADPDDEHLRALAARTVMARHDAERGISRLRSWVAGESTALERADPALLQDVSDRVERWQDARDALTAAARPVRDADGTPP